MTLKTWGDEELTRAVRMRNRGLTPDDIGRALGRSATSVTARLHRHRDAGHAVCLSRVLSKWTPERAERALAMWSAGASVESIADEVGGTARSVRGHVHAMYPKCTWLPRRKRFRAWTPERAAPVIEAVTRGASLEELADLIGIRPRFVSVCLSILRSRGYAVPLRRPGPRPRND